MLKVMQGLGPNSFGAIATRSAKITNSGFNEKKQEFFVEVEDSNWDNPAVQLPQEFKL